MIKNNGEEFLVSTDNVSKIIKNIKDNTQLCTPIMIDQIIKRSLYQVKNLGEDEKDEKNEYKWIRILEGDVDCDGVQRCTVTFKDKKKDMSGEDYALLKVESFDDATHLFDLLKFTKTSYQENKRSKFVCIFDKVKYIIRFDLWPEIEEVVFVAISVLSSASDNNISDFIDVLEIEKYNLDNNKMVDVDSVYEKKFGCPAILIPEVTFDFKIIVPKFLEI